MRVESSTPSVSFERTIAVDAYGRFQEKIPAGNYVFSATAPNAISPAVREVGVKPHFNTPITMHLERSQVFRGVVLGDDSQPIEGASITLSASQIGAKPVFPAPPLHANRFYCVRSDSSGAFSFPSIWPGNYQLVASASGYLRHDESAVRAGKTDCVIRLKKRASLIVNVQNETGTPIFLAAVQLQWKGEGIRVERGETSQEGICRFDDLPSGLVTISASHADFDATDRSILDDLNLDRDEIVRTLDSTIKKIFDSGRVIRGGESRTSPKFHAKLGGTILYA